ncbi:MAG: hypothetical protein AMXMBFR84_33440 [Candidatus Hydrogenedentota bacterium]
MERQIYVTAQDKKRLMDCLASLQEIADKRELPHIQYLDRELARAVVIDDPSLLPSDVITMRSRVRLRDANSHSLLECTLVYPTERAPEEGRISVLAPLGASMLGYKAGDAFEVTLPKGPARYHVEEILYQPESSGDYDL